LGTCWIGAFNETAVKQLLAIPPEAKIVGMTPVGFPSSPVLLRHIDETNRKPLKDIISVDVYGGIIADLEYPER
jgi:nitroreductase